MKTSIIPAPYGIDPENKQSVAYFSMEYALHQPLKIYAGGLGYIAGSFLRSAYDLNQKVTGIGILWKNGFYDQIRKNDHTMDVLFHEKKYHFLKETNINFSLSINDKDVKVTAYYLEPEIFQTAPLYLLSTDLPENDYWAKSITSKLYDNNRELKTAANIVLGVGGVKVLEALNKQPDIYHMNNSDAIPLAFYLWNKFQNFEKVKDHIVYTNYNMEEVISDKSDIYFLEKMNFFNGVPRSEIKKIIKSNSDIFDHNQAALSMAKISNGLSEKHEVLMKKMWYTGRGTEEITHVTTGQNFNYWADHGLYKALKHNDDEVLLRRKKYLKAKLFEEVAEQTGQIFNVDHLTLVWGRKFTSCRRPDLLLLDSERFHKILSNTDYPIQLIFAGKPHPMDFVAISAFDKLVDSSRKFSNFAVLVGHEMKLAKLLKGGADLWLNTQRFMYEASETSGISAAMNGSINISTPDGWITEFGKNEKNSFIIDQTSTDLSVYQQELEDIKTLFDMLEKSIIPSYYKNVPGWMEVMKNSMRDIFPYFDSDRMVKEYFEKIYSFNPEKALTDEVLKDLSIKYEKLPVDNNA